MGCLFVLLGIVIPDPIMRCTPHVEDGPYPVFSDFMIGGAKYGLFWMGCVVTFVLSLVAVWWVLDKIIGHD